MKHRAFAWKPYESAALNARRVLPKLVRDYFESGRKLDRDSGARDMHGFRLKTKHLRYTLEAFVSLYGPGLKQRIDSLRPIQNALGDLNDCEVLLAGLRKKLPNAVRAHIRKRAGEKHKEFLRYWREEFDVADEDNKWEQYLTRSVRLKPAR
jgi:CHAD domain-containing protein